MAKKQQKEIRSFKLSAQPIEVRTAADGTRSISGIAAPFNKPSVDMGFREFIAPGAFRRTLVENPDVLCLRDHNPTLLMGRTKSGTLTLAESKEGLRFTVKLPDTTQAADLVESLSRGDIDACSFGMICRKDDWNVDSEGNLTRTLLDVDLLEISVVSFPAYPDSTAALRSCPIDLRSKVKADATQPDDDQDDCDPDQDDDCEEDRSTDDDQEQDDCPGEDDPDYDEDDPCHDADEDELRRDQLRIRSLFAHRMTP
jgi:HK97 family phage prohead protease